MRNGMAVLQAILALAILSSPAAAVEEEQATVPGLVVAAGAKTGLEMVAIPGGEFDMGSEEAENEKPVHRVRVDDFRMGRYEVTQRLWVAVMGRNPSQGNSQCEECPVEGVEWSAAKRFVEILNRLTGKKYRLPTEAEWEYAAGGGVAHQKWSGTDDPAAVKDHGWCSGFSGNETHPVGLKKPNALGLHDMTGNVTEWCGDGFAPYTADYQENPVGPETDSRHVCRGGHSWSDPPMARTSYRMVCEDKPGEAGCMMGLRLALPAED